MSVSKRAKCLTPSTTITTTSTTSSTSTSSKLLSISSIPNDTIATSFSFLNIIGLLAARQVNRSWRSISFLRHASPTSIEIDIDDSDVMYATITKTFPRQLTIKSRSNRKRNRLTTPDGLCTYQLDMICHMSTVEDLTIVVSDSVNSLSPLIQLTRLTSLDIQVCGSSRLDPLKSIGAILSLRRLTLRLGGGNEWFIGKAVQSLPQLEMLRLMDQYNGHEDDDRMSLRDDIPLLPKTLTNLDIWRSDFPQITQSWHNMLHDEDEAGWNALMALPLTSLSISLDLTPQRVHDLITYRPNLTRLSCKSMTTSMDVSFNGWTFMHSLNVDTLDPSTFTRCLLEIPSLRSLQCNVDATPSNSFDCLKGKSTPLTTLSIAGREFEFAADGRPGVMGVLHPDNLNVLCTISAENLTSLCIRYDDGYSSVDSLEMLSSFSSLTSLNVDNYTIPKATKLPKLPRLTKLVLSFNQGNARMHDATPSLPLIASLYPRLTSLDYSGLIKIDDLKSFAYLELLNGNKIDKYLQEYFMTSH